MLISKRICYLAILLLMSKVNKIQCNVFICFFPRCRNFLTNKFITEIQYVQKTTQAIISSHHPIQWYFIPRKSIFDHPCSYVFHREIYLITHNIVIAFELNVYKKLDIIFSSAFMQDIVLYGT